MATRDTIAAIATASGAGGIGIVRLSGADARRIAGAMCALELQPRHAHYATFTDANAGAIDAGIALWFAGPHSFTGEDVVELQVHGAPIVLARLLARCIELGARAARAGEFSERAFLNGKIDLAQAEAIADLIAAQSEVQARAALRSLQGEFSAQVTTLLRALIDARLHVEAAIERGQRLRDGLHAVIIGAPNAGKSSLLNALSGDERAIVTALAGTTRDLLRESVRIDGIEITLVDTAGLRESPDLIEAEGIRRARNELARADLAILVLAPEDEAGIDALLAEVPTGAAVLVVHNKSDALRRVQTHLADARWRLVIDRAGELVAEELRQAQQALSEITGEFSSDDLLGAIFSSFCIGK